MNISENKLKIDVIVEARMTSSRLPGKVLMPGCGKVMLHHMIERLSWIPCISDIIIATTSNRTDDCIVELAENLAVCCFRGDEYDVLGRVVKAAQYFETDVIVEITGDDPLVDPGISFEVIKEFLESNDREYFVTNDLEKTFPVGFNTRVFTRKLLELVEKEATHPVDREHVVNYICKRPNKFKIRNIRADGMYFRPELRLTLDTQEDYKLIKSVFDALYPKNPKFTANDVIAFLDANPNIREFNKHVAQRTYEYD